jgi:hypothetical protein
MEAPGTRIGVDEPQVAAALGQIIVAVQGRHDGLAVVDDLDQDAIGAGCHRRAANTSTAAPRPRAAATNKARAG